MAAALAYLDGVLRITAVESPFMLAKEADNVHAHAVFLGSSSPMRTLLLPQRPHVHIVF
jgi:hypothetical protein